MAENTGIDTIQDDELNDEALDERYGGKSGTAPGPVSFVGPCQ
jgi:hypothetical protein